MLWQVELGPHLGAVRHTPGKLPNTLLSISQSLCLFFFLLTLYSLLSLGRVISRSRYLFLTDSSLSLSLRARHTLWIPSSLLSLFLAPLPQSLSSTTRKRSFGHSG